MKFVNKNAVIFNPAARTLDFSAWAATGIPFDVRGLMAVFDVTANQMIFGATVAGQGIAAQAGNVVTLQFNTTALGSGDTLSIWYEDGLGNGVDAPGIKPLGGGVGIQGYLSALQAIATGQVTPLDYIGALTRQPLAEDLLRDILAQLKTLNFQIQAGLNLNDDAVALAQDFRNDLTN